MINIEYVSEFDKEFKKLSKKYISLENDFNDFVDVLEEAISDDFNSFLQMGIIGVRISNLGEIPNNIIPVKVRKFVCVSIAGNSKKSGIRIIYFYDESNNYVIFLEIYTKNSKDNHDIERIQKYLNHQNN